MIKVLILTSNPHVGYTVINHGKVKHFAHFQDVVEEIADVPIENITWGE